MTHAVSVTGPGVMGQRRLHNMHGHERVLVTLAWDPDPGARARTAARYPVARKSECCEKPLGVDVAESRDLAVQVIIEDILRA